MFLVHPHCVVDPNSLGRRRFTAENNFPHVVDFLGFTFPKRYTPSSVQCHESLPDGSDSTAVYRVRDLTPSGLQVCIAALTVFKWLVWCVRLGKVPTGHRLLLQRSIGTLPTESNNI